MQVVLLTPWSHFRRSLPPVVPDEMGCGELTLEALKDGGGGGGGGWGLSVLATRFGGRVSRGIS